jgi:two-component system nitrogen regulation sensor histidine kinase NtrY
MDALTLQETSRWARWRRRVSIVRRSRQFIPWLERLTLLAAIVMAAVTYALIQGQSGGVQRLLTPLMVAMLLIANMVPIIGLLVLFVRRLALRKAGQSAIGGRGRLHVRLVALFSFLSAVPTLLVAAFAAMMFQYGVDFWFSDKAKTVLVNADRVATAYVAENRQRIGADIEAMAGDVAGYARNFGLDNDSFAEGLAWQLAARNLSEAAVVSTGQDGTLRLVAGANLDKRTLQERMPAASLAALKMGAPVAVHDATDRIESVAMLDRSGTLFLYAS